MREDSATKNTKSTNVRSIRLARIALSVGGFEFVIFVFFVAHTLGRVR